MLLNSFGCSFVWGSELPDEIPGKTHSQLTWPAILARKLNREYHCHAWGGAGNFFISQQILSQIERKRDADCLFVINWSWVDRFDYINEQGYWAALRPAEKNKLNEFYYRELHSQLQDKAMSLSQINFCLDQLDQAKIPYISTYMDDLLFETQWHTTPAIYYMQRNVRARLINFNGANFVEWARGQQHPVTEQGHLLESGHAAVAENILYRLGVNKIKTACV